MSVEKFELDSSEHYRLTRAALRRLKTATARASELTAAELPEEVRIAALLALGRIGDPEALGLLTRGLEHFPERPEPITALGAFANATPVPLLLKRLENPETPFKDEIVRVLGQIGDPQATRALLDLLHDQDRMVRFHAAWALFKIGGRDVVPGLCRLLSDPDEWIVINVLEILSQLREGEAMPALVGQAEIVGDPRLKAIIISSLASFNDPQLLPVFENAISSFDPRIQANAVEAIAKLKISVLEVRRKLKKLIGHSNNRVRANVAVALYTADAKTITAEIDAMMASPDAPTRRSAAWALSKLELPDRATRIDTLLADPVYSVRRMALRAALALKTDVGTARIVRLLDDENPWVRKEAVDCALRVEDFPAAEVLKRFPNEAAPPSEQTMLRFFAERRLDAAVPAILAKIKRQPEENLELLVGTLGRLHASEALGEARRVLTLGGSAVHAALAIATLLQGELSILDDLANRLKNATRPDAQRDALEVAGLVGEFLRQIPEFSPALGNALLEAARADQAAPAPVPAVEALAAVDEKALFAQGVALFNQGRLEPALTFFADFRKGRPDHSDAAYYHGATLFKLGRLPEARTVLQALLARKADHLHGTLLLGQICYHRKDWPALIALYQPLKETLRRDDARTRGQVCGALGLSRFHTRDFPGAVGELKQALVHNPADLSSVYHLALSYAALKDHAQALGLLKRLVKELPAKSQILRNVEELIQKIEDEAS